MYIDSTKDLQDFRNRMKHVISMVMPIMLQCTRTEIDYVLDIVLATEGSHLEIVYMCKRN